MEEKKKYFKDGQPELYGFFSDEEMRHWTPREKAMWTPYSQVDEAPIPKEVLDFNRLREEKDAEIVRLKAQLEAKEEPKTADNTVASKTVITEDEKKKALIAQLAEKGIKATMNFKVETLEKKLQDANNTE